VARNTVLQPQKFPEQILAVGGEVGKIRTMLRPAHRRRQRDGQNFQQIMALGIARPRIGDFG